MSDTSASTTRPDLTNKAKEVVRDAKAKASELTDDMTRLAKDNAEQVSETARDLANTAKDKVESAVSERKSVGADYISSIARATSQAADAFQSDMPQAAHYIRQASDQIHSVANTVRERDVRELFEEVKDFARQQPTLFLGGAVLLGFAALRFLKSTPPRQSTAFDARREGYERGEGSQRREGYAAFDARHQG